MSSRTKTILQLALNSNKTENEKDEKISARANTFNNKDFVTSAKIEEINDVDNAINFCEFFDMNSINNIPIEFVGVNILDSNSNVHINEESTNTSNNNCDLIHNSELHLNKSQCTIEHVNLANVIENNSEICTEVHVETENEVLDTQDTTYNPNNDTDDGSDSDSNYSIGNSVDKDKIGENIEQSEVDINCEDNLFGDDVRKRKLVAKPEEWKRYKNKKLRLRGKEYLGFKYDKESKKSSQISLKSKRELKPACNSNYCLKARTRQCSEISEDTRKQLFIRFWNNMNWDQRKVYIGSNVRKEPTKTKTASSDSRREGSFFYYLDVGSKRYQVCRNMFLSTFDIGYKMVQHWVNTSFYGMHEDSEVRLTTREKIVRDSENRQEHLNNFLISLPKLPSHYARKDSTKLFLEPVYKTITDVYNIYKEKCLRENLIPYSNKIFNRRFKENNLSLYQLKKDQCNTCSAHTVGTITEEVWTAHNIRKEQARLEKDRDKELAKNDEIICLTMDLQSVKLCPFVNANAFYYKTKLSNHNFTVFDLKTHKVACYWFSEDQNSDLKASTFVSCLLDYLQKKCVTESRTPIVIYSDGCTYQNRNAIMANALLNFAMCNNISVYQKYLEVGHTQLECDSVHALIERKLRNKEIYLPSEYVSVSKEARKKDPYECFNLDFNFFKNFASVEHQRYHSIRPGRKAADPVVTDIKAIWYNPEGVIKVKLNFEEDWQDLPVRPKKLPIILDYPAMFKEPCKISSSKYKHLQDLKSVIPRDCHSFYDNLAHV